MLNVKDGDAIIVYLKKDDDDLLILIDGGRSGDAKMIITELQPILNDTGKIAPDIVVCTHYDFDHIGGLTDIISHYGKNIKEVWMHTTSQIIELGRKLKTYERDKSSILPNEDDDYLTSTLDDLLVQNPNEIETVLKHLQHEVELIELIKSIPIPIKEPIVDNCSYENWPEIKVIGPTMEYYKKLFPQHFDVKDFLIDECRETISNETNDYSKDPCKLLDEQSKAKVTNCNLNSAIILITVGGKKFLFSGDAGIPSFDAIPDFQSVLKDIYWLKVPHHASRNNINSRFIKLMKPQYSYVSGDRHISQEVLGCFADSKSIIETTKDKGHLNFDYSI